MRSCYSLTVGFAGASSHCRLLLCRFIQTPLGRKLPFWLPPTGPDTTKAAAKQLKEAQRSCVSLSLLAAVGDVQRLTVAALQRAVASWQAGSTGGSSGGGCGGSSGGQQGAPAAAPPIALPAAAGGDLEALGRLMPGCHAAPSGFGHQGAEGLGEEQQQQQGQQGQQQGIRFVAVSGDQVVLQVPSAWVLPLLQCCCKQVMAEVSQLLGLADSSSSGSGGGGRTGSAGMQPAWREAAAAGSSNSSPGGSGSGTLLGCFKWWWGSSLDPLSANWYAGLGVLPY
jgi:hypothetical protein